MATTYFDLRDIANYLDVFEEKWKVGLMSWTCQGLFREDCFEKDCFVRF